MFLIILSCMVDVFVYGPTINYWKIYNDCKYSYPYTNGISVSVIVKEKKKSKNSCSQKYCEDKTKQTLTITFKWIFNNMALQSLEIPLNDLADLFKNICFNWLKINQQNKTKEFTKAFVLAQEIPSMFKRNTKKLCSREIINFVCKIICLISEI